MHCFYLGKWTFNFKKTVYATTQQQRHCNDFWGVTEAEKKNKEKEKRKNFAKYCIVLLNARIKITTYNRNTDN